MSETLPDLQVKQIAVSSYDGSHDVIYALCNDGSIWRLVVKLHYDQWYRLPPLVTAEPLPAEHHPTSAPA